MKLNLIILNMLAVSSIMASDFSDQNELILNKNVSNEDINQKGKQNSLNANKIMESLQQYQEDIRSKAQELKEKIEQYKQYTNKKNQELRKDFEQFEEEQQNELQEGLNELTQNGNDLLRKCDKERQSIDDDYNNSQYDRDTFLQYRAEISKLRMKVYENMSNREQDFRNAFAKNVREYKIAVEKVIKNV